MMKDWVAHSIWWHVYPLGFVHADRAGTEGAAPVNRFAHIETWLDYAIDLGVNGIVLGPIFSSMSHGYDTTDYFTVDPRLGSLADFNHFVDAAHKRGIRVVLDGVFNHVGSQHPSFRDALVNGPSSPHWSMFHIIDNERTSNPVPYEHFEGHAQLPTLNHDDPSVVALVRDVMDYWCSRGVSGWRLDAAYAIAPHFWHNVLPSVRESHPDAFFFGEVIHGDYVGFVEESGVDSVTQYELWKAIWSSLNDANFFELDWALTRHNEFLDSFCPITFVGNHDVTRIASALHDVRHLPLALVLLFTLGGIPAVYYGDEQAFRGIKYDREYGDDEVRGQFPDTPDDLVPFGWPTYRLHQQLIALRRQHSWLTQATTRTLSCENTALVYEARVGDQRIVVALNCGDTDQTVVLPQALTRLAGATTAVSSTQHTLASFGWAVFGK